MGDLKSFYSDRTVFITGAHGFKGSWLCILMHMLGARVYGFGLVSEANLKLHTNVKGELNQIKFCEGDVRDTERLEHCLKNSKPDIVFHLAAEPLVKTGFDIPKTVFDVNVMGTVSLLEALRRAPSVRSVVNITTDKVYKNTSKGIAFREDFPLGGDDPYSASKAAVEIISNCYANSFFKETIGLSAARAGNVIGPGDFSEDRLLPDIIRASREDLTLQVRSPNAVRPWQHVADPLIGYVLLAGNPIRHRVFVVILVKNSRAVFC